MQTQLANVTGDTLYYDFVHIFVRTDKSQIPNSNYRFQIIDAPGKHVTGASSTFPKAREVVAAWFTPMIGTQVPWESFIHNYTNGSNTVFYELLPDSTTSYHFQIHILYRK